jgi:branched-subunit amino acid ABC-type transport system permease component
MGPRAAFGFVLLLGAVLGGAYGAVVLSRRVSELPGMTLTVVSLGVMLLVTAYGPRYLRAGGGGGRPGFGSLAPSPFGDGGVRVWGQFVTTHRFATLMIVLGLVLVLALILNRTYTGLAIRAIADDLEASVWCGARLRLIGTGVYAVAGAVAAMAGALFVATVAAASEGMLMLFMRGLVIAVVGGLRSVPLALAGALLFGLLETALLVGLFGDLGGGAREFILSAAMMGLILVVARTRRENFFLLGRASL